MNQSQQNSLRLARSLRAMKIAVFAILTLSICTQTNSIATAQEDAKSVTVPCTVESYYHTDIMSRLDGLVGKINVDLGDSVKKGDVLIELHAPEIKAGVRQKEKLVEKAEADVNAVAAALASVQARFSALDARKSLRSSELTRIKGLVSSGILTRAKRDEATFAYQSVVSENESINADMKAAEANLVASKAEVEVAVANLDYAKAMADYVTIRAPFDGVVTGRNVDPGAYVRPPSGNNAMPLVQLESIDKVRVVIMVPYSVADDVSTGSEVTISDMRGQKELKLTGKITRTGAGFEKGSRTMRAEVELENKPDANGKRKLRAGDYGSALIQLK